MAVQYLEFKENPLILHKFKKNPPKNTNLKSFWAFLLSIFIYISVFYIFNISPSTVLSTTKFWFFISNTLILIIAADFGSFSPSKDHDFYYDCIKNTRTRDFSSFKAPKIPDEIVTDHKETVLDQNLPEEKIIEMAVKNRDVDHNRKEEDKQIIITANPKIEEFNKEKEVVVDVGSEEKEKMKKKKKKKCVRFNSEKIIIVEAEEDEKPVLQRSLSDMAEGRVEENEFSGMSNEELNRRVEDFIRRFNRQIRDQAVRQRNAQF